MMAALIIFGALCVCIAPFVPALVELVTSSDAKPLVVVREQDANIRHFAASFFEQIQSFYANHDIDPLNPPEPFRDAFGQRGSAVFLGAAQKPHFTAAEQQARRSTDVLISTGDLMLEGDFVFEQEIYCGRQLYAGSNNTYRAVYAGTDLILGPNSTVARWLHSQGHVYIGQDSRVFGRISSASSITLAAGVFFERLNANIIRFESDTLVNVLPTLEHDQQVAWEIPPKALQIDAKTLLFDRSLRLPENTEAAHNIVSKGELFLGAGCRVSGNLKAHGRLEIGASSIVRGSLVSEDEIWVGPASLVMGPIVSERRVIIDARCVIGAPKIPTSVTAPIVEVAVGSEICGTLWASREGKVFLDKNESGN